MPALRCISACALRVTFPRYTSVEADGGTIWPISQLALAGFGVAVQYGRLDDTHASVFWIFWSVSGGAGLISSGSVNLTCWGSLLSPLSTVAPPLRVKALTLLAEQLPV